MADRNPSTYYDKFCDRKYTVLWEHIGRAPNLTICQGKVPRGNDIEA